MSEEELNIVTSKKIKDTARGTFRGGGGRGLLPLPPLRPGKSQFASLAAFSVCSPDCTNFPLLSRSLKINETDATLVSEGNGSSGKSVASRMLECSVIDGTNKSSNLRRIYVLLTNETNLFVPKIDTV